jgi:hypothetical protein
MENEYFILKKEQLDAYAEWRVTYDNFECFHCGADNFSEPQIDWLKANPCPLPNPVTMPSEEEITAIFNKMWNDTKPGAIHELGFEAGAKWLLNKLNIR